MKLHLCYYGDPVLRKKCSPVKTITPEVKKLVEDMVETMEANNGIGLAAPQVGKSLRIFITLVPKEDEQSELADGELRVFVNPEIVEYSPDKNISSEGCLSIPTIRAEVERPNRIKVKAQDLDGNTFSLDVSDLEARCIMHENDHINGVLFIDRIRGKARQQLDPKLKKVKQDYYQKHKNPDSSSSFQPSL